jgi:hypothetical protein
MADANVVDVYANCFVRRDRPSGTLSADADADTPVPGLSLSKLRDRGKDSE